MQRPPRCFQTPNRATLLTNAIPPDHRGSAAHTQARRHTYKAATAAARCKQVFYRAGRRRGREGATAGAWGAGRGRGGRGRAITRPASHAGVPCTAHAGDIDRVYRHCLTVHHARCEAARPTHRRQVLCTIGCLNATQDDRRAQTTAAQFQGTAGGYRQLQEPISARLGVSI